MDWVTKKYIEPGPFNPGLAQPGPFNLARLINLAKRTEVVSGQFGDFLWRQRRAVQ